MGDKRDPFLPNDDNVDYSSMNKGFHEGLKFNEYHVVNMEDLIVENPYFAEDVEYVLHNADMIPENWDFPLENLCVVSYRYSECSEYDTGIFLTTKPQNSNNVMDGLPGSSTESLNNRFYAGVYKLKHPRHDEQSVVIKKCLGNGIVPARDSSMFDLREFKGNLALANLLINYFNPMRV